MDQATLEARRGGRWKTVVAAGAIGLHFTLILLVVTHADNWMAENGWRIPTAILAHYSLLTCTNRNFGFFAPSVTPDWNLRIMTETDSKEKKPYALPAPSREMQVKMYSMLGHFGEDGDSMDLFARSWSVHAMNHDPSVVRVDIEVTQNRVPSMGEYRRGIRIQPEPYYKTTFELR